MALTAKGPPTCSTVVNTTFKKIETSYKYKYWKQNPKQLGLVGSIDGKLSPPPPHIVGSHDAWKEKLAGKSCLIKALLPSMSGVI